MKKGFIILGAIALSACTAGYETDFDVAAARREMNIEARHEASGCTFIRDHEAYKNCLLNTHNMNTPATYTTSTLDDGRPVAIMGQSQQYGANTSTCGLPPIPAPKAGYEWAAPTTASETRSVETVCQKKFEPQQTIVQTIEETIAPPEPDVIFVQQELPQPEVVEEPPVVEHIIELEPACPCADPNDPCPQCYDK